MDSDVQSFLAGAVTTAAIVALVTAFRRQLESLLTSLFSLIGFNLFAILLGPSWTRRFIRAQLRQHERLRLPGLREAAFLHRPRLTEVFVALGVESSQTSQIRSSTTGQRVQDHAREFTLATALERSRCTVVLGEPGAGKTTTLQNLVCVYSRRRLRRVARTPLPIFIPLTRLSLDGRNLPDELCDSTHGLIPTELLKPWVPAYLNRLLKRGRCIILLDGLDEVILPEDMAVASRIASLWAAAYPRCRFVLTSRISSYRQTLSADYVSFVIRQLSHRGIENLILRWFRAVHREEMQAQVTAPLEKEQERKCLQMANEDSADLLAIIEKDEHLAELAGNPLLLSLMCLVRYASGVLPRRRVDLLKRCVELLIHKWDEYEHSLSAGEMPTPEQKEQFLSELAGRMHSEGTHEISKAQLLGHTKAFLAGVTNAVSTERFIKHIIERTNLLTERSIDLYGFAHKAFEEFFIARSFARADAFPDELLTTALEGRTNEILVLLSGMEARGPRIVQRLLEEWERNDHRLACFLAARCLLEMREQPTALRDRVLTGLERVFEETVNADELSEAQRLLRLHGVSKTVTRKFAEFEIGDEIGRGGQCVVYKASHPAHAGPLALKTYSRLMSEAGEGKWLSQCKTIAAMEHRHIIPVVFVGVDEHTRYVALEFAEQGTVGELIRWTGVGAAILHIPERRTAEYVDWCAQNWIGLCEALDLVHKKSGFLHRDIKPENLLVHDGCVRITDFDIAWNTWGEEPTRDLTYFSAMPYGHGGFAGTLQYAAPEALHGGHYSEASDVFALGRCLFEALTLRLPQETSILTIVKRADTRIAWDKRNDGHVPLQLRRIVERACAPEVRSRYQHMGEFRDALADFTG